MSSSELFLRDVLDISDPVRAGAFKVELSSGFGESQRMVDQYVVTDQLKGAFDQALTLVRSSVRDGSSNAAYLHGSFGSGKSHFMAVLHAVLNNDSAAPSKPRLQEVIADHDDWLRDRRFLMVPYHLVGATDLDSALLGGYVAAIRRMDPTAPTPPVYRADAMLDDARDNRRIEGDELFIRKLTGTAGGEPTVHPGGADDEDDLVPLEESAAPATGWTSADLDRAFAAPQGDALREALVSALLSGPMKAYARGASGAAQAFLPLEDGLSVITRHAKSLGYDGIVLFIDELILWLQARMSDQDFVKTEVGKLVKVIESGVADRPVPIISFVSRQRNLSQLVGEDVTGVEVKNLESQVGYLAERFDVINLEDRNLPAIIKERVLKPRSPEARLALELAFADFEQANPRVKDALLDSQGATGADWSDFRDVYPLTPALLNVLVALSGALQRERTGLKLLQDLLWRRSGDMKIGQVIPLGDLWDVLSGGMGDAFTDKLRKEGEQANRFYEKVRNYLLEKYSSTEDPEFRSTDRLIKTLLLAYLTPDLPALARLTGKRLADLNHGSIRRTRTVTDDRNALARLQELQGVFGELRSEGEDDPVFALHLSDLDVEPLLDAVGEQDRPSARRVWVKEALWKALGIKDTEGFVCEREIVWRGTRRTVEFVFGNVRDKADIPDDHFMPSVEGRVRLVVDYPFDVQGKYPSDDAARVRELQRDERFRLPTLVWLPAHFSRQRAGQLGRLLKINYLLERERLDDLAVTYSSDDRTRMRHQLQAQRDNLETQLIAVLGQLYGINRQDEANVGAPVGDEGHLMSLLPGHRPRPEAAAGFEGNLLKLADGVFATLYPKHPDFDVNNNRKAITPAELKTVLQAITDAMKDGAMRVTLDRGQLATVKKIVHPLELGEVHDGPLVLDTTWRRRIDQYAAQENISGDYKVEEIRQWIAAMGWTGLDRQVSSLLIAAYALLADRAWFLHGNPEPTAPALTSIGAGHVLRALDKPSEAEFATARDRAASILGVSGVSEVMLASSVAALADAVRGKVTALESSVNGVRGSLGRPEHASALGLTDPAAARLAAARHAVDFTQRLVRHRDDTALIRELAAVAYDISDQELGAAIASAPAVLKALDETPWDLLDSVREYIGRTDGIGDRAQRLLAEVSQAANQDEFARALAPVLAKVQPNALALLREAARLAAVAAPVLAPLQPLTPPEPTGAGQVSLTVHGQPPLPTSPVNPAPAPAPVGIAAPGRTRRVAARGGDPALQGVLADLLAEVRQYAKENPGADIDITWNPASAQAADSSSEADS